MADVLPDMLYSQKKDKTFYPFTGKSPLRGLTFIAPLMPASDIP